MESHWVYILESPGKTLHVGMTNDLARRFLEHRAGSGALAPAKYRTHRLVYCEEVPGIREAIAREEQIRGWDQAKLIALVESLNPDWNDLSETGSTPAEPPPRLE